MSKSKDIVSDDVKNLFQTFGGNPDRYQERSLVADVSSSAVPAASATARVSSKPVGHGHGPVSGLFKQRAVASVESSSDRVADVAAAVSRSGGEYAARLAASPWFDQRLIDGVGGVEPIVAGQGSAPLAKKKSPSTVRQPSAPVKLSASPEVDASVSAATVPEVHEVHQEEKKSPKTQKKHQIFIEPKPLSKIIVR